jgi:ribokinase
MTEVPVAKVVVVGSVNLDLVVHTANLPAPGETVLGGDMRRVAGGKGANQAVAAARLGVRTVLFAATGDDPFAADVRAALGAEGIELSHVETIAGASTGVAMVVVGDGGENAITVAPGANRRLVARADAMAAELSPADVLVLQLEVPVETCLGAARAARRSGARVVLNAAPPPTSDDTTFEKLLGDVDVLVVNETEALGIRPGLAPRDRADWEAVALALTGLGPSASVVTLGAGGAVFAAGGVADHQPAFTAAVVDSTGAGDAFCGALATGMARGASFAAAVRLGCAAGALATRGSGPQAALPTAIEVDELLTQDGVDEQQEDRGENRRR